MAPLRGVCFFGEVAFVFLESRDGGIASPLPTEGNSPSVLRVWKDGRRIVQRVASFRSLSNGLSDLRDSLNAFRQPMRSYEYSARSPRASDISVEDSFARFRECDETGLLVSSATPAPSEISEKSRFAIAAESKAVA